MSLLQPFLPFHPEISMKFLFIVKTLPMKNRKLTFLAPALALFDTLGFSPQHNISLSHKIGSPSPKAWGESSLPPQGWDCVGLGGRCCFLEKLSGWLTWKQAAVGLYFTGAAYLRSSPQSQALKQLLTINSYPCCWEVVEKNYRTYLCISWTKITILICV